MYLIGVLVSTHRYERAGSYVSIVNEGVILTKVEDHSLMRDHNYWIHCDSDFYYRYLQNEHQRVWQSYVTMQPVNMLGNVQNYGRY